MACLCLAWTTSINAQDENQFSGSILWKISGKGLTKTSYILGSQHLINPSFLNQVIGYTEAFNQSEVIVGEVDTSDKEALTQQMQAALILGEGEKGYSDILNEEELQSLTNNLLKHLGIPLTPFLQTKPALITTLLAVKLHRDIDPSFDPQNHVAIDEHIQQKGIENKKQIIGLETAQEQIDILFSDPVEEQLKELICALNEMDLGEKTYRKLNEYYESGDLIALYNLMTDKDPDIPQSACPMSEEKKEKMLDDRNQAWLKKIPGLLKTNSNLIVVGAGHLPGKEGLLYQLAKMGYLVEPVK